MFKTTLLRHASRALTSSRPSITRVAPALAQRSLHLTRPLFEKQEDAAEPHPGEQGEHVGQLARTDESIQVEYPEEKDMPSSAPVQGRGGHHFKRTLASFSLEGRVALVTGGARGLGLVMSQALVISGADVAIVDLNSKFCERSRDGGCGRRST